MTPRLDFACVVLFACCSSACAATYDVGSGQTYATLADVPALAPGDVVQIHPGTYHEVKRWTDAGTSASPIIIRGLGATRPVVDANAITVDGALPNPRAVFQIEASNLVIEHLEFVNARNGNNGSAVRVTGGGSIVDNVVIRDCRLHGCDMGIQSDSSDHLLVDGCEIDNNGTSLFAGYSHNVYLNGQRATFRGCWIHDAIYGQNVKSRGHYTELLYNLIADSQDGEVGLVDSAETTAANSNAVLIGNIIISKNRGATWNNARFVMFGSDGGGAHNGTLYAINNTFVAGATSNNFLWSNRAEAGLVARNNVFFGSDAISNGSNGPVSGSNNWLPSTASVPAGFANSTSGALPGFVNSGGRDFHLLSGAACRDIALASPTYLDGAGASHSGVPAWTYEGLGSLLARASNGALDAGAYEFASGTLSVALTAPTAGANFIAPASIPLTATANDTGGTISKVEFYRGTTLLGTSFTAPYSYNWNAVPVGSYSLTAKAYDNLSAITTSAVVSITVTPAGSFPVTVTLTSPANGANFTAPATIAMTASAAGGSGSFSKVEFYHGAALIGTSFSSPFAFTWNAVPPGSYALSAKAYDSVGATGVSPVTNVTVGAASGGYTTTSGSHHCGGGSLAAAVGFLMLFVGRLVMLRRSLW